MIPFMLNPEGTAELHRLRDYAHSRPISFYTLKKMMEGMSLVPGDDEYEGGKQTCLLPPQDDWEFPKFKVVYSVEEQYHKKEGLVPLRHLSVSVLDTSKYPHPAVVEMIMKELGFKRRLEECKVWLDEPYYAVNVLDFYEDIP